MKLAVFGAAVVTAEMNINCSTPDAGTWCDNDCSRSYYACMALCSNDPVCLSGCARIMADCQGACPCNTVSECVDGCPCDSEYCRADVDMLLITPEHHQHHEDLDVQEYMIQWFHPEANEHLLTRMEPFSPGFPGEQRQLCPVVMKGQLYLFGGQHGESTHQVVRVNHCHYEKLPNMSFKFENGRCTSIDFTERALLCASQHSHIKECHIYDGMGWVRTKDSKQKHDSGGLVEHQDKVFLFAGDDLSNEKFNKADMSWVSLTRRRLVIN